MTGVVFDIREMTVHDGDGVRVTVFLKGCSLRCSWCHNPEGLRKAPQLLYKRVKCTRCGLCEKPCGHAECRQFGRCLHICPNDCLRVCGEEYAPERLAEKLTGYKRLFDACGGGVTFSGGEPLMQWEFLSQTLDRLHGIPTAIETSGFASESVFRQMLRRIDFVYMDIKLLDSDLHKKHTGADNALIKNNFRILRASGKPYTVRTPLIKGITDGEENLRAIKEFIGDSPWEQLPENPLAKAKYDIL
ncbi:MAG: glycyl-radical enzyme activating protein [Clostridia bacterium]|nr:glycyl-radical enzyme activating protein [Clostridia bacterium]